MAKFEALFGLERMLLEVSQTIWCNVWNRTDDRDDDMT
jgi:hypothetical protein